MPLTVHVFTDHQANFQVLQVRGDVDLATIGDLERSILGIDAGDGDLIIDLSATEFLDSSGLRLLTATRERLAAGSRQLRLVVIDGAVKRVLEVTDLLGVFDVYPTLADALR